MMQYIIRLLTLIAPALFYSSKDARIIVIALIVANLTPFVGVVFFSWDSGSLIWLYWLETLIIGFYNFLTMLAGSIYNQLNGEKNIIYPGLFLSIFFVFHFGGFNFVHGVFIAVIVALLKSFSGGGADDFAAYISPISTSFSPFTLLDIAFNDLNLYPSDWGKAGSYFPAVILIALMQGYLFYKISLREITDGKFDPGSIMIRPYPRIVFMHLFIMIGFALTVIGTIFIHAPTFILIFLWIAMKTYADLKQLNKSFAVKA